ncbi:MAG: CBS domain-containing protein [Dehalococcoidia bacterium]
MKVKDIAMKETYCTSPTTSLSEISAMMKRHGIGVMPVCNDDNLVGMITDRDIAISCVAAGMDSSACQAKEFMTSNPVAISSDTDVEEAARIMSREQVRRLPVVDDGHLAGMLSLGDVAVALQGDDSLIAETLRKISTPTQTAPTC